MVELTKITRSVIDDTVFQTSLSSEGSPVITADSYVGGFKNLIMNGDMRINQRGHTEQLAIPTNGSSKFAVDRWKAVHGGFSYTGMPGLNFSGLTVSQSEDVPTEASFASSFKAKVGENPIDVAVAEPVVLALSGTAYDAITQFTEAGNFGHLRYGTSGAKPLTLSFWVKCSHVGKYSGSIRAFNIGGVGPSSSSYVCTYNVNQTNTWEFKTIYIAPNYEYTINDKANESYGLSVLFALGGIKRIHATASEVYSSDPTIENKWVSGDVHGFDRTVVDSIWDKAGAEFYITGVQLEIGDKATAFEHKPVGAELALCQRYYTKSYNYSIVPGASGIDARNQGLIIEQNFTSIGAGNLDIYRYFPVKMRAVPTVTFYAYSGSQYEHVTRNSVRVSAVSGVGSPFNGVVGLQSVTANESGICAMELSPFVLTSTLALVVPLSAGWGTNNNGALFLAYASYQYEASAEF
jgi:hypothetical protein